MIFGTIRAGDLGGWIEKEENLSHERKAWICDDAEVCGNVKVCGDAKVCGNAKVCGDAKVCGNAKVWGNAEVCDDAKVCGDAKVCDDAKVWGNAEVCDDAKVWGNAKVYGNAKVWGNAEVFSRNHVLVIGPIGSRSDFTTFYRGKEKTIMVKCGCFNDSVEKFLNRAAQTHGKNKHATAYQKAAELAELQIDPSEEPPEGRDKP